MKSATPFLISVTAVSTVAYPVTTTATISG